MYIHYPVPEKEKISPVSLHNPEKRIKVLRSVERILDISWIPPPTEGTSELHTSLLLSQHNILFYFHNFQNTVFTFMIIFL